MNRDPRRPAVQTSPAHDYFQLMFDSADVFQSYWQPLYKSTGRWQLEMAQLAAKNGQTSLEYSHRIMKCRSPFEAMAETMNYWQKLSGSFAEATRNMTSAAMKAAQPVMAFDLLPLPLKRMHDTIVVPEQEEPELPFERRVA